MVRVGILGAGGMGSVHARQYRKRSDVELFFFDRNPTRSKTFQDRFQAAPCSDLKKLLNSVDLVDICLPTPAHKEVALESLSSGKPTLIEKPMAGSLEDAVEVAEAAERANVLVMPAHVLRFFPEYRKAHELIKSGAIGKPAAARLRRGAGAPSGADGWFMDISKSGGVLLDLSIHDFDWLRWTLGEVNFLYSRSIAQKTNLSPDYALTTITFDNGCIAHVEGTWMDPGGFRTHLEVAGSMGLIQHDSRQTAALRTTLAPAPGEGAPLPNLEGGLLETDDPYYLEIDAFMQAAQKVSSPAVSVVDGLMAVSISEAAIQSARTNIATRPARHF